VPSEFGCRQHEFKEPHSVEVAEAFCSLLDAIRLTYTLLNEFSHRLRCPGPQAILLYTLVVIFKSFLAGEHEMLKAEGAVIKPTSGYPQTTADGASLVFRHAHMSIQTMAGRCTLGPLGHFHWSVVVSVALFIN
jgi:hypothetical protein